jgi:transcriptional regulator with XRE-family HTH domain
MMNLTFGEQVKIILSRKGMTIKELAEKVEAYTGKPMSRQNMTQRLGRDNFQERDMRMIAEILGCPFTLNIIEVQPEVQEVQEIPVVVSESAPQEKAVESPQKEEAKEPVQNEEQEILRKGIKGIFKKTESRESKLDQAEIGEINPYTRKEYESNSVRMHPTKIGYVQVYDKDRHKWTEMTEWAFLGYQDKRKQLLGKDYKPPIYLD